MMSLSTGRLSLIGSLAIAVVVFVLCENFITIDEAILRPRIFPAARNLRKVPDRTTQQVLNERGEEMTKQLNETGRSLCPDDLMLDDYPLPDYESWCEPNSTLNIIPFFGGMTNGLKFVLLGALMSLDEGRCFIVDEEMAHLNRVAGPGGHKKDNFIGHFFDGIGLSHDHPFVLAAFKEGRTHIRPWKQYWMDLRKRRNVNEMFDYSSQNKPPLARDNVLHSLGYDTKGSMDGHALKRDFLRRMWHLKPEYREATCRTLREHNLFPFNPQGENYIGFSVRRGDKDTEGFVFPSMEKYIDAAHSFLPAMNKSEFHTPTVFVATDDCTVLPELREKRQSWKFISQCREENEKAEHDGFVIRDIVKWDDQQREDHFAKFFVELYALALSRVYVGVGYTNVAWFAYFLRPAFERPTFILLDDQEKGWDYNNIDYY